MKRKEKHLNRKRTIGMCNTFYYQDGTLPIIATKLSQKQYKSDILNDIRKFYRILENNMFGHVKCYKILENRV